MVGCAAPHCHNSSRHRGLYKFYRFPADPERRKIWVKNCKRENWFATSSNFLCNVHFEESAYEQHRLDGKKKLKPNAVPTIFPEQQKELNTIIVEPQQDQFVETNLDHFDPLSLSNDSILDNMVAAAQELKMLREELKEKNKEIDNLKSELSSAKQEICGLQKKFDTTNTNLKNFLSDEQIEMLSKNSKISKWSDESVMNGIKIKFALGKHGYMYLHNSGYPCPSYSTLNRRKKERVQTSLEY